MIGQRRINNWIDNLDCDNFPNFILLSGGKGSGKTTIAKTIAKKLNATFTVAGIKVDEIREVIDTAYTVKDKTLYCIQEADTMRNEAKNALLKITEEPPKNAYFVLTVCDDSTVLDTIKSRAMCFTLDPYTFEELQKYFWSLSYVSSDVSKEEVETICTIATTPYEVERLIEYGKDFIDFVNLVVDFISEVEPANAFKTSNKLAIKSDEGYDLKLFWEVFVYVCMKRLEEDCLKYTKGACATIPYIAKIQKLGVNKQQVYDSWVFEIREVWQ